jgi:hypothetical protein
MFRVLRPLPELENPAEDISMHFILGPSECEGFHAVWVVVDKLLKMRHCIPRHTPHDAVELAKLLFWEVVRLHSLPNTIVSERGPQFASTFWGQICNQIGIDQWMSTAFHPLTDGKIK